MGCFHSRFTNVLHSTSKKSTPVPVPALAPLSGRSSMHNSQPSENQPSTSTSHPTMELSRPPSRMDWEFSPPPPQTIPSQPRDLGGPGILSGLGDIGGPQGASIVVITPHPNPIEAIFQDNPRSVPPVTWYNSDENPLQHPSSSFTRPDQHKPLLAPPLKCMACVSTIDASESPSVTVNGPVYPCGTCKAPYCVECVREIFIGAMKDESRMPPRCCQLIQLSVARSYLSSEEIAQFKLRYEEWSTPNRLYCPVPACSTFISPRIIRAAAKAAARRQRVLSRQTNSTGSLPIDASNTKDEKQSGEASQNQPSAIALVPVTNMPSNSPSIAKKQTQPSKMSQSSEPVVVECPNCSVEICASCKQLNHSPLPCLSEDDINPEITNLLKKWHIKRCPKCRAAVRRMYGCSHIRCRCGAQWCWYCLGPIDECRDEGCTNQDEIDDEEEDDLNDEDEESEEGLCQQPDNTDDDNGTTDPPGPPPPDPVIEREILRAERRRIRALESGDLDAAMEHRENLNLGDEPNADELDPWNCEHRWKRQSDSLNSSSTSLVKKLECQRCWREVYYDMEREYNLDKLFTQTSRTDPQNNRSDDAIQLDQPADAQIQKFNPVSGEPSESDQEGTTSDAKPGVECEYCGITFCNDCRDDVEAENMDRWMEYQRRAETAE